MTRSKVPTLHCDAEDGCDAWDVDYYESNTSTVGGVQITATARAPGWTVTPDSDDLCRDHSSQGGTGRAT